jgi:hypothetical protein
MGILIAIVFPQFLLQQTKNYTYANPIVLRHYDCLGDWNAAYCGLSY